jgi:hypothetical protein
MSALRTHWINPADLTMSVNRGKPEAAGRGSNQRSRSTPSLKASPRLEVTKAKEKVMKGLFTIAALSIFALPLFAVASVANAQTTAALQSCMNMYPGPVGKACCFKAYTPSVSYGELGRAAYAAQMCVNSASSKKK